MLLTDFFKWKAIKIPEQKKERYKDTSVQVVFAKHKKHTFIY